MQELRDKNPFHCIITGPTNCGKTRYVIDQLRGSFRHVFEWIVLICPTYSKNKTYRGFAKGDKRFVVLSPDASNVEEINDLLGICEDFFSGTNTLIILDDCAVSRDLKNRTNKFINLAFSGRYAGLSVWVLTQQLTSIAKTFRDNVACVVAFHNPSQIGMKSLFDEFGGDLDSQTRKNLTKNLKSENYSALCFSLSNIVIFEFQPPEQSYKKSDNYLIIKMSDLDEMTFDENQKTNQNFSISAGDVEYQKESLVILASLGTTKEYLGVEMSLEKIHKLSDKEVEKYFNRYKKVAGQKMANGLVDSAFSTATKVISCFLPIDDTEELCYNLQNDELVKRELSNIAGLLVVRGGRLVALGSALFEVARHIKFNSDNDSEAGETGETAGDSDRESGENQNLRETEGSDANKIEAGTK